GYSPFVQVYRKQNDTKFWKLNSGVNANNQLNQLMPYQYTGRYTEGATGYTHLDARWYNPYTQRFNQPDYWSFNNTGLPKAVQHELMRFTGLNTAQLLTDPAQQMRYGYVRNNPVSWSDVFGLATINVTISGAADGGGDIFNILVPSTGAMNPVIDDINENANGTVLSFQHNQMVAARKAIIAADVEAELNGDELEVNIDAHSYGATSAGRLIGDLGDNGIPVNEVNLYDPVKTSPGSFPDLSNANSVVNVYVPETSNDGPFGANIVGGAIEVIIGVIKRDPGKVNDGVATMGNQVFRIDQNNVTNIPANSGVDHGNAYAMYQQASNYRDSTYQPSTMPSYIPGQNTNCP
ncbi:MAG: hypothetical protein OEX07_15095, partial [Gammaproteobacteria bacterium]|nr:hypothetical protein [Gammaproteobacteria bacterium]